MKIELASNYGFCFGVQRAIEIAEKTKNANTFGPLIHNTLEINRLKNDFNVGLKEDISDIDEESTIIVRTHGIEKNTLQNLKNKKNKIIDATCPYVKKPQNICEKMSKEGYYIIIFGDKNHPEIKGVRSYSGEKCIVVLDINELKKEYAKFKNHKVALVSQTTKKIQNFQEIASYLIANTKEVRIFNTICNATYENQEAAEEISKRSDIMIVIGGEHSSNTKQLLSICKEYCKDSYFVENENNLNKLWFKNKNYCGITAGASTPDWIIQKILNKIKTLVN